MIKCENVSVFEELFSMNEKTSIATANIPVQLETHFAPNIDENANDARQELIMEIGEPEKDDYPFYYKIRLAGIFSWENMTIEEARTEISSDGVEILYSFIRTYFYEMLNKTNIEPVVLPKITP